MKPTTRRAIALLVTCTFMLIYVFFALSIGNLFEGKPVLIRLLFFCFAGLFWVIPLYPLYKWMRPKSHELVQSETAPLVSRPTRKK